MLLFFFKVITAKQYDSLIDQQEQFIVLYTIGPPTKSNKKLVKQAEKNYLFQIPFHIIDGKRYNLSTEQRLDYVKSKSEQLSITNFTIEEINKFIIENANPFMSNIDIKAALKYSQKNNLLIVQQPINVYDSFVLRQINIKGISVIGDEPELKNQRIDFNLSKYFLIKSGELFQFDGHISQLIIWSRSVLQGKEYIDSQREL